VIYPISQVPQRYQWLLYLNPLTGAIQVIRSGTLHEGAIQWSMLGISGASAAVLFGIGMLYFKHQELRFADII